MMSAGAGSIRIRSAYSASAVASKTLRHIWTHPAVQDQRLRATGRYLGWQAWQRAARRPVTIGMPAGIRLRCYPHSSSASAVLYTKMPDWEEMQFLLHFLRPGDTFVDVGANIGVYTLLASSLPGVRVEAFEPSPPSCQRLTENVQLNRLDGVTVHRMAVGDSAGAVAMTRGLDSTNRLLPDGADRRDADIVPICRLDDALSATSQVSLVKIDVEGFEPAVIRGARALFDRCHPALIIERNEADQLTAVLRECGYTSYRYDPISRRLTPVDLYKASLHNIIACMDVEIIEGRVRSDGPGAGTALGVPQGRRRLLGTPPMSLQCLNGYL